MSDTNTIDPQHVDLDARVAQRMREIVAAQAFHSIQAEDAAKAQAQAAAAEKAHAYLDQVMRDAIEQFKTLGPAYAARAQAAADLNEPLARFWQAELEIRAVEIAVGSAVFSPFARAGLPHTATVADLRTRAGLAGDHAHVGLPVDPADEAQRLAGTVVRALALGLVFPDGVAIGEKSVGFNFDQGA